MAERPAATIAIYLHIFFIKSAPAGDNVVVVLNRAILFRPIRSDQCRVFVCAESARRESGYVCILSCIGAALKAPGRPYGRRRRRGVLCGRILARLYKSMDRLGGAPAQRAASVCLSVCRHTDRQVRNDTQSSREFSTTANLYNGNQ